VTLSVPPAVVELRLTDASGVNTFTLNDPTKGLLNNSTYTLGGAAWTDVTDYVLSSSIRRGKNTALGRYNAGTATVTLDNRTARYAPTISTPSTQHPYAGQIKPRTPVRISIGAEFQFVGIVQDWDYDIPLGGVPTATISAADGFTELANRELSAQTFATGLSSTMINAVLDSADVLYPADARDIETGRTTMAAQTVTAGTNALSFLQLIESSEPGALFINRAGNLTFRSRRYAEDLAGAVVISDDRSVGIPFTDLVVEYGTELLYNRVSITRTGGAVQTAQNTASIDEFGIWDYSETGLFMSTDTTALGLAQYYANGYSLPAYRPVALTINLASLDSDDQITILSVDIDDAVRVKFTPQGGELVDKYMLVSGVAHRIGLGTHSVTFDLIDAFANSAMIFGDAAVAPELQPQSLLDSNRYGF